MAKQVEGIIPVVLAISPTMKCNYTCGGCYSRGRSEQNELSFEELDQILQEAETLGIAAVVVTGGEPFSRKDFVALLRNHPKLLFVVITNGSYLAPALIQRMVQSGNVMVLVSIEGGRDETDARRGEGAYSRAIQAMRLMKKAGLLCGFAVTTTRKNAPCVFSGEFLDTMKAAGCALGFFTEYVPCGEAPQKDWMIPPAMQQQIREQVLHLRRRKSIVIVQFPHDEYGAENLCSAAGRVFFHINSQGDVEPCPFSPYSHDNVRQGGLKSACNSSFFRSIRSRPELLQRKEYACALFEHQREIEALHARIPSIPGKEEPNEHL
ncbi:MAG: radical SAM protein [Treponemataceae bacterium]|nr:radical SAM protein [Treponemataceae bacterium]